MSEFQEKLRSIQFGSVPGGTRRQEVNRINQTEKNWDRDIPAYRRMRSEGLQPRQVDGSAHLEAKANDEMEVNTQLLMTDKEIPARLRELKAEVEGKDVKVP